jgi:hypothetical protein
MDFGASKSYSIPAMEILGFDFLLNRVNHRFSGSNDYDVTSASLRSKLRANWVTDNDPYKVNQFAHPYQGSMYHGFARSAGLGYWELVGNAFLGSAAWEIAGERTRPAVNDQIASGIAGSFLGEALFRISSLVLKQGRGMLAGKRYKKKDVTCAASGDCMAVTTTSHLRPTAFRARRYRSARPASGGCRRILPCREPPCWARATQPWGPFMVVPWTNTTMAWRRRP